MKADTFIQPNLQAKFLRFFLEFLFLSFSLFFCPFNIFVNLAVHI